jgi:putative Mn2+ efflux pump MntP
MTILDLIVLSIALAMDCFTVSIIAGLILEKADGREMLSTSFLFGFFQAFMPFIGWLATHYFATYIEAYDHWIAFGLLAFIGGKMIRDSFRPEDEHNFNPRKLRTQLILAVATSIDAMAVGISFACMGYTTLSSMALPLTLIGLTSFLFGIVGHLLGIKCGDIVSKRLKPELVGGILLIAIGAKILLSHLLA